MPTIAVSTSAWASCHPHRTSRIRGGGWSSDPVSPNWPLEHVKDEEIELVDEPAVPMRKALVVRCTSSIWPAGVHEARSPVFAGAGNHQNSRNQNPGR